MTSTKYILTVIASFSAKLLNHEGRANYSTNDIPNFNNNIVSNMEEYTYTFTFNQYISQPDRLNFVEATRKGIDSHE